MSTRQQKQFYSFLNQAKSNFKLIKNRLLSPEKNELYINAYRGYGTTNQVYIKGRIIKNKNIVSTVKDNIWENLINSYKRFESDEIPNIPISIEYQNKQFNICTDNEGYYLLQSPINGATNTTAAIWEQALISVATPFHASIHQSTISEVLIVPDNAQFGIISDIDDTVLETHVVSKFKMLYHTIFKNAFTRFAFKGVAAWYWALHKGSDGNKYNPIFYVSHSPWNLYDMLNDFMEFNNLPKGVILLRDLTIKAPNKAALHLGHKYHQIAQILNTYPNLPFVLIGDSGEKDADIYQAIERAFPNRILAIYIRLVNNPKRTQRMHLIADAQDDIEMILIQNSQQGAKHALQNNLISPLGYEMVKQV